eukprot:CCRYP_001272-RB/>CCRYP_001272-RB protein AED:0.46 eAED:1.00 QI:0/0/0/1/0/0/2/0/116
MRIGAQVDRNAKVGVTHEDDSVMVGTPMLEEVVEEDAHIHNKKEEEEVSRDWKSRPPEEGSWINYDFSLCHGVSGLMDLDDDDNHAAVDNDGRDDGTKDGEVAVVEEDDRNDDGEE